MEKMTDAELKQRLGGFLFRAGGVVPKDQGYAFFGQGELQH